MRKNVEQTMRSVLGEMARRARLTLGDDSLGRMWPTAMESSGPGGVLAEALSRWSMTDARPLVLFIDELDALVGIVCCRCCGSCAPDTTSVPRASRRASCYAA